MEDEAAEALSNGHVPTYVPSSPPTPPPPVAAANGRPRQAWAGEGGCAGRCARCCCAPWRALCMKCKSCCARCCKCSKCCQPKPEKAPEDTPGCCGGRSKVCAKLSACCGGGGAKDRGGDKGGCCTRLSPCCASPRCFKISPCFARLACCRAKKPAPPAPGPAPPKGDAEGGDAPEGEAAAPVSRWRRLLRRLDCRRVLRACCGCCDCEGSLKNARCTCTMDCRAFFCGPLERCRERCRRRRQPTIASKKSTSMEEGSFGEHIPSDGMSASSDDGHGF